jgi:hypothetical protein
MHPSIYIKTVTPTRLILLTRALVTFLFPNCRHHHFDTREMTEAELWVALNTLTTHLPGHIYNRSGGNSAEERKGAISREMVVAPPHTHVHTKLLTKHS